MKKKQSTLKIIGLFVIVITLLGLIFAVNNMLQEKPGQAVTTIKKTKAASKTYSRLLALNNPQPTVIPTIGLPIAPNPTETLLAKNNAIPTGNQNDQSIPTAIAGQNNPNLQSTTAGSQNQNNQLTPTIPSNMDITNTQGTPTVDPTTELLALNRNNTTITTTKSISPTSSIAPTKTKQLPETGWIQYSLILFAAATTLFFLAFIF